MTTKKKAPGIFITFEGTEGAGKSTLIRHLIILLEQKGKKVFLTREPGGNEVSEKIRDLVLKTEMAPRTEVFLYEAARAENLARAVLPALNRGEIVLCDRFTDSTLAYQAHAQGLPWKEVKTLNQIATQGLTPDLTIFLDVDPTVGLQRAVEQNRFEIAGIEFQKKVRAGFLKAGKEEPQRWLTFKVKDYSPEKLADTVFQQIQKRFKKKLFP